MLKSPAIRILIEWIGCVDSPTYKVVHDGIFVFVDIFVNRNCSIASAVFFWHKCDDSGIKVIFGKCSVMTWAGRNGFVYENASVLMMVEVMVLWWDKYGVCFVVVNFLENNKVWFSFVDEIVGLWTVFWHSFSQHSTEVFWLERQMFEFTPFQLFRQRCDASWKEWFALDSCFCCCWDVDCEIGTYSNFVNFLEMIQLCSLELGQLDCLLNFALASFFGVGPKGDGEFWTESAAKVDINILKNVSIKLSNFQLLFWNQILFPICLDLFVNILCDWFKFVYFKLSI